MALVIDCLVRADLIRPHRILAFIMRKRKKYDITFIPIPTELYKDSELDYLLVKILEKRQKTRKKSWKNGRNTLFFIGKVEIFSILSLEKWKKL